MVIGAPLRAGSSRESQVSSAKNTARIGAATMSVCSQICFRGQKNSTPRRKPTNSGGSPSGESAPPILATRMMKKTTTWTVYARPSFALSSGRIRIIAAPVVPTTLATKVPIASSVVLTGGVPRRFPVMRIPPAAT